MNKTNEQDNEQDNGSSDGGHNGNNACEMCVVPSFRHFKPSKPLRPSEAKENCLVEFDL